MEYQIWLNGEYSDRDKAQIPMLDRGFRIGDVVFDTSRTFNGEVFKLRDHLDRLYRSLKYVRIDPGMSIDEMERITFDVVAHNEDLRREMNDDYMITQIVTGGNGQRGDTDPNVSIWIDPLGAPRWAQAYSGGGAHAVIPKTRAYPAEALDPKVKHYSRLNFVLAEMEARDVDSNALPLMLDMDGKVSEGTGGNFFIVTDGTLKTPRDNSTLQGVSRMTVMEIADTLGIPAIEDDLQPYDLYTADEAFFCSTPYSILPVGRIDNRELGDDAPGPVTNQLLAAWSERVGLDIVDQLLRMAQTQ
jgi:branched-chain amino acid aminotransferase